MLVAFPVVSPGGEIRYSNPLHTSGQHEALKRVEYNKRAYASTDTWSSLREGCVVCVCARVRSEFQTIRQMHELCTAKDFGLHCDTT